MFLFFFFFFIYCFRLNGFTGIGCGNSCISVYDSRECVIFHYTHRTLPAGYMEMGESAADGAIRETREEANAEVEILSPFVQLDIPLIGQVRK